MSIKRLSTRLACPPHFAWLEGGPERELLSLRPYVHDVAAALAARGGLVLERVLVDGLDDDGVLDAILFGTFADGTPFAPVHLRPSDGIALALRTGAALEVAEEVWRRVDRYDAANLPFDELRDGDLAGY